MNLITVTRLRPHCAGAIWKRSFIFMVWHPVKTNPSRKWSFPKRPSNDRNSKTPALRFPVDRKHFENGSFRKRGVTIILWFLDRVFLKNKSKIPASFNFVRRSAIWKHLMRFQGEISTGVIWTEPERVTWSTIYSIRLYFADKLSPYVFSDTTSLI